MSTQVNRPSPAKFSGQIFMNVLRTMQDAEEIGGPEGADYIELMEAIAAEAKQRRDNYAATLSEESLTGC